MTFSGQIISTYLVQDNVPSVTIQQFDNIAAFIRLIRPRYSLARSRKNLGNIIDVHYQYHDVLSYCAGGKNMKLLSGSWRHYKVKWEWDVTVRIETNTSYELYR